MDSDIENAYSLLFSSDNVFTVTLSPTLELESKHSYTVQTVSPTTTVASNGQAIGKIVTSGLSLDNVYWNVGNKNIAPTEGTRRYTPRKFEASDGVVYAWKWAKGEGWNMRSRRSNELVATLRPHYVLGQEQHTLLLSISPSYLRLQDEIVLTILYLEQYRRKRWDVRRSYRDDFLLAVTLA